MYYKHIITGDVVQVLAYDGELVIYEKQKPQMIGDVSEYRFSKPMHIFFTMYRKMDL